jgi:ATP-dependent DNA helicase DinG
MGEAVGRVLQQGGLLLVEAGTGTGKTIAYLAPAAWVGTRVVVSTGTKNLQEQIVQKDLPLLARALGRPVSVAVMKGRANYLCKLRFDSFSRQGTFMRREEIPLFRAVSAWASATSSGDRAEIRELPDSVDFWRDISASGEQCIGQACAHFDDCWVTQMRRRALEAQVVVVNHHLLCADLALDEEAQGRVVPEYDTLILDEAHMLEDAATQYFGVQVSTHRVEELAHDLDRELSVARIEAREARLEGAAVRERSERFFALVGKEAGKRLTRNWRTAEVGEEVGALLLRLEGLATAVLALPDAPDPLTAIAHRARDLTEQLRFLVAAEDEAHVFFAERRGRGIVLRASPIDVAGLLRERLFGRVRAAVLTSATLAVGGGFEYIQTRLGLGEAETLQLESPFDFARQAVLYVPRNMPEPNTPDFVERVTEEVARLIELSHGRAFVLFTSYANMNAVAERLAGDLAYPLFVQGEAPKPALLELFRATPGAVLLATASFWQGVDVVGEQLSCVIIDKLPFASPSDPIVAARIEHLTRQGRNAFAEYQVPEAVLTLKQGLGRLIRSTSDRGVLAVLDSRLVERPYGRRFLASLPPARLVHDLEEARAVFD